MFNTMKKAIFLLGFFTVLLFSSNVFSQSNNVGKENDKDFIKAWVIEHPEVKIISKMMYDRYNNSERSEFDHLKRKIVYQQYLTKEDIIKYEKSQDNVGMNTDKK